MPGARERPRVPRAARSQPRSSAAPVLEPQAEHGFQIVGRKLLERDHRLRSLDSSQLDQVLNDDLRKIVVLPHANDGDEVPISGHRVDLGHAFHVGELGAEMTKALARCFDEDECCQHKGSNFAPILNRLDCQGMPLDILQARGRTLALFERYGALLTEHQREVIELYLKKDWSLAEIAAHQRTSRAAVHDLLRRSTQSLQDYEKRLGLLAEAARRHRAVAALERELNDLKERIARLDGNP